MKNTENRGFNFALPFDPFRLLLAVLEKFWLVLLAAAVCGALGVGYAVFKLGDTYSASVTIASEGWQSKRADEGSSYVPMPFTDEAVVIAANAEEVFEIAAKKIDPNMPGGAVRARVGLEQLPGEGMFSLDAKTSESKEMTHKLVIAYAEGLMEYTAKLRQDVARREYLQLEKQLTEKQAAVKESREEMLEYTAKHGIIDPLGTNSGAAAQLTAIKTKLDDAKLKYASNNDLIISYIRKEGIAPLKLELTALLNGKSATHPLVLGKKQEIERIEKKLATAMAQEVVDITEFEYLIPDAVYSDIKRISDDRIILANAIASYTDRLNDSTSNLGSLGGSSLAMIEKSKVLLLRIGSAAVISGQMGDAEFFATNAPAAVSIFQATSVDEVQHKSLIKKAITLGVLGLIGGAGAVIGLSLLLELISRKVRTPMQAAIAAGAYPKLVFPPSRKTTNEVALRNFWIRGVARFLPGERRMIFPVIGDVPNEAAFWSGMFDSVKDQKNRVVFIDYSTKPLGLGLPAYSASEVVPASQIDPTQFGSEDLLAMVANFPEGHVLIVRWDLNANATLADLAPHMDRQYILTSQEVSLSQVEEESINYRDVFGDADGLVLVNSKRPKRSQMIVNRLQDWYLESYRRRDLRSIHTPLAH